MPKKKPAAKKPATRKAKPAPPRPLSKAEAFYVESHFGLKAAAALAAELGAPEASVAEYLESLRAAGFEPKAPKTPAEKAGFAVNSGSVSMTPVSSERGDRFRGVTADGSKPVERPRNEEFLAKRVPGLHVINPDLPVI